MPRTRMSHGAATLAMLAIALVGGACGANGATVSPAAPAGASTSGSPAAANAALPTSTTALLPPPPGRVAFGRYGPHGVSMFTANTDGSGERALFPPDAEDARWSPDGRHISIVSQNSQGLIFFGVMEADGSGYAQRHSPDPSLNLGCVAWSPDSFRLACEGWDESDGTRNGIYTVRASDGGDLTRVTTAPVHTHDTPGDYSPDGKRIVFHNYDLATDTSGPQMVVNVDGTARHALNAETGVGSGDWSPDGKAILTETIAGGPRLLLVPTDGGPSVTIDLDRRFINANAPAWSPDGEWIAFSGATSSDLDIYVVRRDGTDLFQVTHTHGRPEEFPTWVIPAI
jgi:Tol biopolymer transport system component